MTRPDHPSSAEGMRDASETPARTGFWCATCGRFNVTAVEGLFRRRGAGSPQRFCDPACRQAAYRRRRAGVREDAPLQPRGGRGRRLNPNQSPQNPQPTDPQS
jgi:hypothetical protein